MEAVGLLGGVADQVRLQIRLPNLLGQKSFLADPYAQFKALRQLSEEGFVPLAVYHSHPQGGVELSLEDLSFCRRVPYVQLVIALARRHNPAIEVAGYEMAESGVKPVLLELVTS